MKTVKHTLRLPVSAINKSGHCSALSALHCQRNRAPYLESSCYGAQILSLHFYVRHTLSTCSQAYKNSLSNGYVFICNFLKRQFTM